MKGISGVVRTTVLGLAAGCLLAGGASVQAREIEQLSLTERITLTLGNSLSQEYQYGPDDVVELAKRADFYLVPVAERLKHNKNVSAESWSMVTL